MKINVVSNAEGAEKIGGGEYDAVIIPVDEKRGLAANLPEEASEAVKAALSGRLKEAPGSVCSAAHLMGDKFLDIVLFRTGNILESSNRELFLRYAGAMKRCRELEARKIAVLLDNAPDVTKNRELCGKICELPFLVSYNFRDYKTGEPAAVMESADFITDADGFDTLLGEATVCATSTLLARDLTNHPSNYMTASRFADEAVRVGKECGAQVSVFDGPAVEALGMKAFLSVAKAAGKDEPRLVVMRFKGGRPEDPIIGFVGKGVIFDSGGYTIKSAMSTMHDDMGGAAALLGAMRAVASLGVGINAVAVMPLCRNMIAPDAYVPGDVIGSMAGKTIQVLNTDAEGRLLLADGITYAIRKEGAGEIVDIASLTGAAKQAVGNRSAAVLSNDEGLFDAARRASLASCEKIWRLDLDRELRHVLDSPVADISNSKPGNTAGAGAIIASLFLREFVEDRPWLHIDMAPVNWESEDGPYFQKGATGYGVSLLYWLSKIKNCYSGCEVHPL